MKIDSSSFNPMIAGSLRKPANIPIEQKMTSQINALNQGTENTKSAVDLLKTAESALNSVSEPLKQMKELAIQASNGIMTDGDRNAIQKQIEGLKSSINDTLKNSEFNQMKLFSQEKPLNIQSSNQGSVMKLKNTSLENLGIADFDVRGANDLSKIDGALAKVNESRSSIGAQTNGFETIIRSNDITSENTTASKSNLQEDLTSQIMAVKKQDYLKQYNTQILQKQMESQKSKLNILA